MTIFFVVVELEALPKRDMTGCGALIATLVRPVALFAEEPPAETERLALEGTKKSRASDSSCKIFLKKDEILVDRIQSKKTKQFFF